MSTKKELAEIKKQAMIERVLDPPKAIVQHEGYEPPQEPCVITEEVLPPKFTPTVKLKPRQMRFALEYLKDKNGASAATRAGYKKSNAKETATELLNNPHVKAYIHERLKQLEVRTMITAERILFDIAEVGKKCKDAVETVGEDGRATVNPGAAAMALRAAELLGKHLELWTDKVKQEGSLNISVVVNEELRNKMSKEEKNEDEQEGKPTAE